MCIAHNNLKQVNSNSKQHSKTLYNIGLTCKCTHTHVHIHVRCYYRKVLLAEGFSCGLAESLSQLSHKILSCLSQHSRYSAPILKVPVWF